MRETVNKLNELCDKYDNEYGPDYRRALVAIGEDRAAYWTSAGYGSQITWAIVSVANSDDIDAACEQFPAHQRGSIRTALEYVIPLNAEAKAELAKAKRNYGR